MRLQKNYYVQMLILAVLTIFLSLLTAFLGYRLYTEKPSTTIPTESSTPKKQVVSKSEDTKIMEDFLKKFFTYSSKNYISRIDEVSDLLTEEYQKELKDSLRSSAETIQENAVSSEYLDTAIYQSDVDASNVYVEITCSYSGNGDSMEVSQLLKIELVSDGDKRLISNIIFLHGDH